MKSVFWLVVALVASASVPAEAYPWMIRHGYTNCAQCHVDPSGSGLLTPYGRAQHEMLVPALYGKKQEDIDPKPGVLFGLIQYPDWLNAGISLRGGLLYLDPSEPPMPAFNPILMVADLRGEATVGPVHAVATLGYDIQGAVLASLTNNTENNIVSREHYLALDLADRSVIVMAGRMNLPFGLRNIEHPSWVRSETRTDINTSQEYGVQAVFNTQGFRASVMGFTGNYLLRFPTYREEGYSAYAELALARRFTLGVSSLVGFSDNDLDTGAPNTLRQTHGLFSRWSPVEPLVFLAELDALISGSQNIPTWLGYVSFLQADWEIKQGVHLYVTGETLSEGPGSLYPGESYGGWLGASYFFFAYGEVRIDGIYRENALSSGGHLPNLTVIAQLHLSM